MESKRPFPALWASRILADVNSSPFLHHSCPMFHVPGAGAMAPRVPGFDRIARARSR
jgi:hypothetical protein